MSPLNRQAPDATTANAGTRRSVAYVTTGYPLLSHTFISREVHGLREQGFEIPTFTVERSSQEHVLSERDRQDFARTYALRPARFGHFAAAHLRAVLTRPRSWARALRGAVGSAGADPRAALWQVFYFAQAVVLWDRVRRTDARHIHAHFANVASDLALLATQVGGAGWTWSFTMHGPREFSDLSKFGLARKARDAGFVVCISAFSRSQVMALLDESEWGKLEVVHCAVETDKFEPHVSTSSSDALNLLFVGRLVPVKGVAVLLDAISQVLRDGTRVKATIVGAGPSRAGLEDRRDELGLGSVVTFAGPVGQDDIVPYYASADVFALTSFAEGVPVVLMEAMAMGLPVLACRVAGVSELVEDSVSGHLVGPGDVDAVARALRTLAAASPARRQEMGAAGRAKVLAEFDSSATSRELAEVYRRRLPLRSDG